MAIAHTITQLQRAATDLIYMSETDAPLEVVQWEQNPEDLKTLLADQPGQPIETVPLEQFFRSQTQEHDWYNDDERERAGRFQALVALLNQHLQDIQVFKVGNVEKTVYVLGRLSRGETSPTSDGGIIGLKTTVVET